jgi:hypothetical protein
MIRSGLMTFDYLLLYTGISDGDYAQSRLGVIARYQGGHAFPTS